MVAVWREWLEGLKYVRGSAPLTASFVVFGIALFGDSLVGVMLPAYVLEYVGVGSVEYAWVLTARGVGGIIGGLIIGNFGKRFKSSHLIGYRLIGTVLAYLATFQIPVFAAVLFNFALLALPVMAWLVAGQTWVQVHSPDELRGRVFGAEYTTIAFMQLFATLLGGVLGDRFDIVAVSNISVVLYIISGILALEQIDMLWQDAQLKTRLALINRWLDHDTAEHVGSPLGCRKSFRSTP